MKIVKITLVIESFLSYLLSIIFCFGYIWNAFSRPNNYELINFMEPFWSILKTLLPSEKEIFGSGLYIALSVGIMAIILLVLRISHFIFFRKIENKTHKTKKEKQILSFKKDHRKLLLFGQSWILSFLISLEIYLNCFYQNFR